MFYYDVDCIVTGSLKNEIDKTFIEQNYTLITVNNEIITKTPSDSKLKFMNTPQGFNNVKSTVNGNDLVFYTYLSPYESEINLIYR